MVREGEFARLLVAASREHSTLSSNLRDAWDQTVLSTISRGNTVIVEGAHVSLNAHITRHELTKRLTQTEMFNGFANRLLWACVDRSKRLASGGYISDGEWAALADLLRPGLNLARRAGLVRRDKEAEELWEKLYHGPLAEDPPGLVGMLTARGEPQVIRLSLLFALLDDEDTIRLRHLEQAWEWWKFSHRSVEFLFGESEPGESGGDAAKLLVALREAGCRGLTKTEQFVKAFGRHRTSEQIEQARRKLADQGLVWSAFAVTEGATKPTLTTWAVVPGWRG
jgi:hypothetical protein